MAHTERQDTDGRSHPLLYPEGSTVAMRGFDGKLVYGTVTSTDDGGWIYVTWKNSDWRGNPMPGYLRSTHAILISLPGEEKKVAA